MVRVSMILKRCIKRNVTGEVFKVHCLEDKKLYAVKKAKEKYKGHGDRNSKLEEVRKHEFLPPHTNIVRFYKSWEQKGRLYQAGVNSLQLINMDKKQTPFFPPKLRQNIHF